MVSWTSLALLEVVQEENPPQVNASNILPTPESSDFPIVTKRSPESTSSRIPLTALNTASSRPPMTTLKPSLKRSIILTIQPTTGTSSSVSETFPKASPSLPSTSLAPLPSVIRPLYAPLILPEAICCNPSLTFSILVFRPEAVFERDCRALSAVSCKAFIFSLAASALACAVSRACRADSFSCSVPDCCASMYDFWAAISAV